MKYVIKTFTFKLLVIVIARELMLHSTAPMIKTTVILNA